MKHHRKLWALMVVVMLVLSLAACKPVTQTPAASTDAPSTEAPATETAATATTEPQLEPITITAFSETANYAGEQSGWFGKLIKDKFNLTVNIEAPQVGGGGDSVFATKLVSGELGDYVAFGDNPNHIKQAIEAGLLLDWTQNGLLDTYGKDILKYYSKAVEFNKTQYGGGKAVYGLGHDTAAYSGGLSDLNDFVWGPYLRWDLYAKLGYPEINEMEDYLKVLKDMQNLEPQTADGKPTYAFSFWKDWDGTHMMNAKQFCAMQDYSDDAGGMLLICRDEPKYQGWLQEDGLYLRTLKLYFDANQMGLVDPESITQNFDTMNAKATNGQLLFSWFSFVLPMNTADNMNAGRGMMLVPFKKEIMCSEEMSMLGGPRIQAIGANTKYPERIMQFINWMCEPEGVMENVNGPKGMAWDYDANGKPVLTELGEKIKLSNETVIPDEFGGGKWSDGNNKFSYNIVNINSKNPNTDETFTWNGWSSSLTNPRLTTKLAAEWQEKMGAKSAVDWFQKYGKVAPQVAGSANVDTTLPDDLKAKCDQVGSVIKEYSWKMVFAKDLAEFEKLKAEMITKAKGLGYDDVLAANIKMAENMFAKR